ncbi:dnaJ homolog subfamily C member 1 [Synchiropus picturatus]
MGSWTGPAGSSLLVFIALVSISAAWDADLELLDLVEEIPQTFYQFMSLEPDASAAEIKKSYRRLSLILHPDKNKHEDAETQFRQLVGIYEVLKDEERRRKYDDILVNGLPDWRQPVFYYRRVRKMSNAELAFLLFLILTVGHYAVIWSIYLEKQLDQLLSKKKKERKKKLSARSPDEGKSDGSDQVDRADERPHWQDLLPLKVSIWLYQSVRNLPETIQEVQQYYEEYKLMKQQQKEEAEADQCVPREKKPKVKKPKMEFPVYEPVAQNQNFGETKSIEDLEEEVDVWLQDHKAKKKAACWTEQELSCLSRLMVKFPGGTPGRWDKIAHELGRSVVEVTTKVKQAKENVSVTPGLVKLSELKAPAHMATQRGAAGEESQDGAVPAVRQRNKKSLQASASDGSEVRVRGRRQQDFDPNSVEEEDEPNSSQKAEPAAWTQNQQKLLELALQQFPRGTTDRWDRIAKVVPGKSKEDCVSRYKLLAELVQKKRQAPHPQSEL